MSAFHPLMLIWGQNYFGGGVAILGAALLFGALRRLMIFPEARMTFTLGLGLFFLAITRPFEGLLTAVFSMIIFFAWIVTQRQFSKRVIFHSVILPLSMISICIGGALAFYNWRVTESLTRFPYQVHEETYSPTPLFIWSAPREVKNDLPHIESFHSGWSLNEYQKHQDPRGYFFSVFKKSLKFLIQMLYFPLCTLLLTLPWGLKNPWTQIALSILLSVILIHLFCMTFFQIFYLAPVIPLVFYVLIQGARHWRAAHWKNHSQGTVFLFGLIILYFTILIPQMINYVPSGYQLALSRARLIDQLKQMPEKDLVFVKYSADHDTLFDWVYNRADIENAEVVWANILTNEENQKLIEHFADHQVWWIDVDSKQIKLRPLSTTAPVYVF
ncbi:hypothetical protein [Gimesia algae]|nr:hypothetical protein [Gimesia algae]